MMDRLLILGAICVVGALIMFVVEAINGDLNNPGTTPRTTRTTIMCIDGDRFTC